MGRQEKQPGGADVRVRQDRVCKVSNKPAASGSVPQLLLGDLGREKLGQRAEGSLVPASSIICGCWLGFFSQCAEGQIGELFTSLSEEEPGSAVLSLTQSLDSNHGRTVSVSPAMESWSLMAPFHIRGD